MSIPGVAPWRPELTWQQPAWKRLRAVSAADWRSSVSTLRALTPAPLHEGELACLEAQLNRCGGALSLGERAGVRVREASARLLGAIRADSLAGTAAAARDLAGLGEGSTPAGDDFLVGVMYAVRATLPEARAARLCEAIAAAAAPLTTRLSAEWLRRAAGGEAIPAWSAFFSALLAGRAAGIRERSTAVLALGHTSGRAALAGFVATVDVLLGGPA